MSLQDLKDRLESHKLDAVNLEIDVKLYCQDTSKNLDERWNLFVESGFGSERSYVTSSKVLEEHGLEIGYDADIYMDKYQTNTNDYIIEILLDLIEDRKDDPDKAISESIIPEYKEETLQVWEKSFTYDW